MNPISKLSALLLIGIFVLYSCKKDEPLPIDYFHYEYAGHTKGRFVVYDVLEVYHDVSQTIQHDSSKYQLKTVIGDTVIDNEGRLARKFLRYTRDLESDPWVLKDIWTSVIADFRFEVVEENQRVIKLVFKPTIDKTWDANAFNPYASFDSYYENLHKSYSYNGHNFDSTLTVEHENELNLIEYKRKFEIYAKGFGLVRKHFKDLKINNFDSLNISSGMEMIMNYRSSGFE